jgi:hypothetical protein
MNDFHYDSPTFCNRDPTEIASLRAPLILCCKLSSIE